MKLAYNQTMEYLLNDAPQEVIDKASLAAANIVLLHRMDTDVTLNGIKLLVDLTLMINGRSFTIEEAGANFVEFIKTNLSEEEKVNLYEESYMVALCASVNHVINLTV